MVLRSLAGRRHLLTVAGCTAALVAGGMSWVRAQQPPQAPAGQAQQGRGGGGGGRGNAGPAIFTAVDANKDGAVTRDEMKATFDKWFTEWDSAKAGALTQEQLTAGLNAAMPAPAPPAAGGGFFPAQGRAAATADAQSRARAGDDGGAARPRRPPSRSSRARCSSSARPAGSCTRRFRSPAGTIEEMGKKTGAWTTTITYDSADINEANLKQYDAIFLASTTGAFLDDPNDAAATAARRKALLDFVRGGKGLAGIHAATDSYHQNRPSTDAPAGGGRAAGPGGPRWAAAAAEAARAHAGRGAVRRAGRQERRSEDQPRRVRRRSPTRGTRSSTRPTRDASARRTSRSASRR